MKKRFLVGLVSVLVVGALSAAPAVATSPAKESTHPKGPQGENPLVQYCQGLGDNGTTALEPAILTRGGATGPNFACNNWTCVQESGAVIPIAATGPAPSMTDACNTLFPGVALFAYPTDPNEAFSWVCEELLPAAGPGIASQDRAAVSALVSTEPVQTEIATLRGLVGAHHQWQALVAGVGVPLLATHPGADRRRAGWLWPASPAAVGNR